MAVADVPETEETETGGPVGETGTAVTGAGDLAPATAGRYLSHRNHLLSNKRAGTHNDFSKFADHNAHEIECLAENISPWNLK